MKKGDILVICLILCCICSLQAIVASDLDNTSIKATDNDVVSIENVSACSLHGADDALKDSENAKNFTYLKDNLDNGDFANYNYTWEEGDPTDGIVLSGQLTLDGEGKVIIDAKNNARIFKIAQEANITLKGITFINGNATVQETPRNGGAVLANGEVYIEGCNFYNNTATNGNGGAIAFDVNAKNCKIIDSTFYNNSAHFNGGAINFDEGSTNNTIKNSEFINNTVYGDGGAINFDHGADLCSVYNSTFTNNAVLGRFGLTSKGGTICIVCNNVTIKDSTFTLSAVYANTTENAKENETCGGAMFVTGNFTVITNCTFDKSYSVEDGGALYVIGDECKLYNSTFTNNTAGDGIEKTLEEVGKTFCVTRERVRQIESKAKRKLSHPTRLQKLKGFI